MKRKLHRVVLKRTIKQYKTIIVETVEGTDVQMIRRMAIEQDNGTGYAADPDERIRRYVHTVEPWTPE